MDGDWGYVSDTLTNAFFGDNSITEIPKSFSTFDSLVTLNLDSNNIQEVESSSLPQNMHTFSLNNNLLKSFPSSLGSLRDLRSLSLRGNEIMHLDLPLFISMNIELIDVSENAIESIKFFDHPNRSLHVWDFNLASNKLTTLPADVFRHVEASRIHLSSNGIRSMDEYTFRGLEDILEYLNLENNQLSMIPTAVSRLRRLSYLYLANNEIRNFTSDSFLEFSDHLKALSIATNELELVPASALLNCMNLLHLNLGYNKIFYVEPGDFDWAESLEILLLRNNVLTQLKANTFKGEFPLNFYLFLNS